VSGTITFSVTGVSAPGITYDPQSNVQTEASIEAGLADPPFVEITSPFEADTLSGTVLIQVSASSSLGISFVQLSVDGVPRAMDASYPYAFSWDTGSEALGPHTLTVTAQDTSGGTESTSVHVTVVAGEPQDDIPPDVSITYPQMGAVVAGIVSVSVNASDNVEVARVELYVDGNLTTTSTLAPFTMEWDVDETPGGQHVIRARAFDAAGNSAVSSDVSVAKRAFLQRFRRQRR